MTASGGRVPAKHLRRGDVIDDPYVLGVLLTVLSCKRWSNGTINARVVQTRPDSGLAIREVQLHPDQRVTVFQYGESKDQITGT